MTIEIPQAVEVNCETGEVTSRPLTDAEIAANAAAAEAAAAEQAARDAEVAQKEADRQAGIDALKKLGLTDAQIAALVG